MSLVRRRQGWYVCCNGRFILEADQTIKTGWGEVGNKISIPKSHHQFARFRGYAFFRVRGSQPNPLERSLKQTSILESPYYKKAQTNDDHRSPSR